MRSRATARSGPAASPLIAASICGLGLGAFSIALLEHGMAGRLDGIGPQQALAVMPPTPVRVSRVALGARPPEPIAREQAVYLVRRALLALNDANRTGHYSVLRDQAGPSFRRRNSAQDLASIFSRVRASGLDMSGVGVAVPAFDGPPVIDTERRLRTKGSYVIGGRRVLFNLVHEVAEGEWRLFEISIGLRPAGTG